jgi:hypothetical protein
MDDRSESLRGGHVDEASNLASYMTGTQIVVDGGRLLA